MNDEFSFLGSKDAEVFSSNYVSRSVTGYRVRPDRPLPFGDEGEKSLLDHVVSLLRRHQSQKGGVNRWTERCVITVRRDDGMSWAAEAVRRKLAHEFPHFDQVCLPIQSESEHRQQIRELVGDRAFIRHAAEHKLQKRRLGHQHWGHMSLFISAILGAIVVVAGALISTELARPLLDFLRHNPWMDVLIAIVLLLVIFISKQLDIISTNTKSNDELESDLWEKLSTIAQQSSRPPEFDRFVDSLARDIGHSDRPRIVLVDDFERLDILSRCVLEYYFDMPPTQGRSSELWVVFELDDGQTLRTSALFKPSESGFSQIRWYRLLPLTERQKFDLATRLGHPETAHFSAVRAVCEGSARTRQHIADELRHFREDHRWNDQQFDSLSLLYLLATTAEAGDIHFTVHDLRSRLSKGDVRRADPLRLLLRGHTGLISLQAFENVATQFASFVNSDGAGLKWKLQSTSEVAEEMEKLVGPLKLESPGLAHLFWSLFWHDNANTRFSPSEAFLMRKLVYHLDRADLSTCPAELQDKLREQLFEAALYTSAGLRRTCIFKNASLERTLSSAVEFFQGATADQKKRWADRLLRNCWDAYSILGQDSILEQIFQISRQDMVDRAATPMGDAAAPGALFFAALGLTTEARDSIMSEFTPQTSVERQYLASAQDYAFARASWLIASVSPILSHPGPSRVLLRSSTLDDLMPLHDLLERCRLRLTVDKNLLGTERLRAIDVAAASHCLWSAALILCESREMTFDHWKTFNSMIDSGLLVASQMKKETSTTGLDTVVNALARELSALAVASLAVAWFSGHVPEGADLTDLSKQVIFGEAIFGLPLADPPFIEAGQFNGLLENLDVLLTLCAFVWNQLGLDEMCVSAHIRRCQFSFLRTWHQSGPPKVNRELTDLFSANDSQIGYTNIMANCVAARCHAESAELAAHFVREIAISARKMGCSAQLLNETSLLAVSYSHSFSISLDGFLAPLLEEQRDGENYLSSLIDRLNDQELNSLSLQLLNCTLDLKNDDAIRAIEDLIALAIPHMEPGIDRETVSARLDSYRLKWEVSAGKPLPEDRVVLDSWQARKELAIYPDVLRILINHGDGSPEVRKEALAIINKNPSQDNGNFLLALALIRQQPKDQADIETLAAALSQEIVRWESASSVEANINTFRFLKLHKGTVRTIYLQNARSIDAKLEKWEKIRIERDHMVQLRNYVDTNRYFFLIDTYCSWAWFWGLQRDLSDQERIAQLKADSAAREKTLRSWKEQGGLVPELLQYDYQEGAFVSSQFLILGRYLFEAPFDQDKEWRQDRARFNEAARKSWPKLIQVILKLEKLPFETRDLLGFHAQSLLQYDGIPIKTNGKSSGTDQLDGGEN